MKTLTVFIATSLFSLSLWAMPQQLKCLAEFSKSIGIAVADTLPVTSVVADEFVSGSKFQRRDGAFSITAELLGGALTFVGEAGLYTVLMHGGIPPAINNWPKMWGATKIPYRSTKKQWQQVQRYCDRRTLKR